jgi:Uma2 family endonuclease
MVTRFTTDTIPEYYDEGSFPWPWPEDELPERIFIEMLQASTIELIGQFLKDLQEHRGDIASLFMISNIPIRYDPSNRRVFIAPDWYISFDVDMEAISEKLSYDVWEVGKPPEFALEVASPSTYRKDLYEKPDIYAYIGIGEYWMFDPTGGDLYGKALSGFRLVDGGYEPIKTALNEHGLESGYSEVLRLRLCAIEKSRRSELLAVQRDMEMVFQDDYNPAQLLVQDPETGLYLLNVKGIGAQANQAETRADRAEAERDMAQAERDGLRAELDAERARAEQVEAENAELREKLQRMGRG